MTTLPQTDPSKVIHFEADEGPTIWFAEGMYTFKATAETTNGALTFAEGSILPGDGPPPHYHEYTDEAFYVLSGELEILSGEETFMCGERGFVWVPRGVRHRFFNRGIHPARLLFMLSPGGMDEFFTSIGTEPHPGEIPPPFTPEQRGQIAELAPNYGLIIG
jgi:mannose-6-phosphate isomerase-like protein (cupin superfamily)